MTFPPAPTPSMRASGAAAGVTAGLLVAASAALPLPLVACVFVGLGLLLAWGWPRLVNLPSPRGTASVLALTAVALAAVMLATPPGLRTRWGGAVLSVGLIGSFLHQLLRQDGRPRLVMSLAGTALGLGMLGAGSYLLPARDHEVARHLLVAAGVAVALGALVDGVAGATSRRIELGIGQVLLGGIVGGVAVIVGAEPLPAIATGALSGLLSWSCLRTTVTIATSAHTRAQLAAGSACALICCFVPFGIARLAGL